MSENILHTGRTVLRADDQEGKAHYGRHNPIDFPRIGLSRRGGPIDPFFEAAPTDGPVARATGRNTHIDDLAWPDPALLSVLGDDYGNYGKRH